MRLDVDQALHQEVGVNSNLRPALHVGGANLFDAAKRAAARLMTMSQRSMADIVNRLTGR